MKAPDGTKSGGWGSHQPALKALAKFTPIRSIVEFGAGTYSTHLFLDREHFPLLTSLTTFEHEQKWVDKVEVEDERLTIVVVPPESFMGRSNGMHADFVFIDCAPTHVRFDIFEHAMTIAPIVGLHDSTELDVAKFNCKYVKAFNSVIQTVFVSNIIDLSEMELECHDS